MLVTALSPVIGYDKAFKDRALCDGQRPYAEGRSFEARLVTEELFDRVVDPAKMVRPYVAEK